MRDCRTHLTGICRTLPAGPLPSATALNAANHKTALLAAVGLRFKLLPGGTSDVVGRT